MRQKRRVLYDTIGIWVKVNRQSRRNPASAFSPFSARSRIRRVEGRVQPIGITAVSGLALRHGGKPRPSNVQRDRARSEKRRALRCRRFACKVAATTTGLLLISTILRMAEHGAFLDTFGRPDRPLGMRNGSRGDRHADVSQLLSWPRRMGSAKMAPAQSAASSELAIATVSTDENAKRRSAASVRASIQVSP